MRVAGMATKPVPGPPGQVGSGMKTGRLRRCVEGAVVPPGMEALAALHPPMQDRVSGLRSGAPRSACQPTAQGPGPVRQRAEMVGRPPSDRPSIPALRIARDSDSGGRGGCFQRFCESLFSDGDARPQHDHGHQESKNAGEHQWLSVSKPHETPRPDAERPSMLQVGPRP